MTTFSVLKSKQSLVKKKKKKKRKYKKKEREKERHVQQLKFTHLLWQQPGAMFGQNQMTGAMMAGGQPGMVGMTGAQMFVPQQGVGQQMTPLQQQMAPMQQVTPMQQMTPMQQQMTAMQQQMQFQQVSVQDGSLCKARDGVHCVCDSLEFTLRNLLWTLSCWNRFTLCVGISGD